MTRGDLHALVDALPEESIDSAAELLRRAQDPVVAKLDAAPYDDEPLSEEERAAVEESRREPAVPWAQAASELGAD
jgi:hypothetical protein